MGQRRGISVRTASHKWRKVLVIYAVCWTVGIGMLTHIWGNIASADTKYNTYVVESGDTLWSIAQHVDPNSDPRSTVKELLQINHMDSADLRVGQQILLPSN